VKLEHWLLLILAFLIGALGQVPLPENQNSTQDKQGQSQNYQIASQKSFYDFTLTDAIQAFFAFVLGIVAIFQIRLMFRQNVLIDQQNRVMDRQTDHMEAGA
jgi:hypothetical protein